MSNSIFSMKMTRRTLAGAAAAAFLFATPAAAAPAPEIEAKVDAAIDQLIQIEPGTERLFQQAEAVLVIPEIVKASLVVGGAYGEGALRVGGTTHSYWNYAAASIGYQAGAQTTNQAMFFMTPDALAEFESQGGFEIGADAEVTVIEAGAELAVDTTEITKPIVVIVYGREGLLGGVSLQGGKYTRVER